MLSAAERLASAACAATVTNLDGIRNDGVTPIIRATLGASPLHAVLGAWTFVSVPHFAINIVAATIAKLKLYRLIITFNWFVVNP